MNTFPRPPSKGGSLPVVWTDLSVKPFQLMKLKNDVNDAFKAGTIVSLSDEAEDSSYSSPTKYPGQGDENKDSTSTVRIYKWVRRETMVNIHTVDGRRILHAHLRHPGTNKVPAEQWEVDTRVMVQSPVEYKTAVYPPRPGPDAKAYSIPNGLVGSVVECLTPSGATILVGNTSRAAIWSYVVKFTIHEKEHVWVPCRRAVSVLSLEPLTASETAAVKNRILKTKPGMKTRELISYKEPSVRDYDI
ncbi:hypothetical protein C8T65DRAFT_143102 [Cerioporus squamosus]|nr:hypothetical protein C8T65DRAFT_143102 [Cerioporus squamosus]